MAKATVTIKIGDLPEIQNKLEEAAEMITDLKRQLTEAQKRTPAERNANKAVDALREFVRFAKLDDMVPRGDYIRYQVKAILAAETVLADIAAAKQPAQIGNAVEDENNEQEEME